MSNPLTAIIDNDIKHQLRESIAFYNLEFRRINLSSEAEILATMQTLDEKETDIIAISRGGGEHLEIFNKTAIAEKAIQLKSLLVTAIGHKDDVTLLQKVADKSFITPSEFSQFLNDTYNHTVEELQHSRAQLVDSVTKQLTAGFEKEIANLREQVKNLEELKKQSTADMQKVYEEKIQGLNALQQERQQVYEQQLKNYQQQVASLAKKGNINWVIVIIAILLGLVIGYLIKSH
jgi:exodeoxyribonuclease VII large subunit